MPLFTRAARLCAPCAGPRPPLPALRLEYSPRSMPSRLRRACYLPQGLHRPDGIFRMARWITRAVCRERARCAAMGAGRAEVPAQRAGCLDAAFAIEEACGSCAEARRWGALRASLDGERRYRLASGRSLILRQGDTAFRHRHVGAWLARHQVWLAWVSQRCSWRRGVAAVPGSVGDRDVAAQRTGMYSQRFPARQ